MGGHEGIGGDQKVLRRGPWLCSHGVTSWSDCAVSGPVPPSSPSWRRDALQCLSACAPGLPRYVTPRYFLVSPYVLGPESSGSVWAGNRDE